MSRTLFYALKPKMGVADRLPDAMHLYPCFLSLLWLYVQYIRSLFWGRILYTMLKPYSTV